MRVIGSHAISTRPSVFCVLVGTVLPPLALVSGEERLARRAPLRLLVDGLPGDAAEAADRGAIEPGRRGRHLAARWLVHERHELVREARHRAPDADPAHVRAPA